MAVDDLVIGLVGEGNESGVGTAGTILTKAAANSGFNILTFRSYPSRIWGGLNAYQVRVSKGKARSMGDHVDVLVAFDPINYQRYRKYVPEDGVVLCDEADKAAFTNPPKHLYALPFKQLVQQSGLLDRQIAQRMRSIAALGALSSLFHIPADAFKRQLEQTFGQKKAQFLEANLKVFDAGFQHGLQIERQDRYVLPSVPLPPEAPWLLTGNEAIGYAALIASQRTGLFFAGYPITPASTILEYLEEYAPLVDPRHKIRYLEHAAQDVFQAEDELASITMLAGASFAGAKAMTATSGPGFSLMMEGIGQAAMHELPMVVVDVQRAGPSTGMPTKTEQSDFGLAWFAGHGDVPKVILSVGDVEDCFYQTLQAFNLAELCQTPVFLLSELAIADRVENIKPVHLGHLEILERTQPSPESQEAYLKYRHGLLSQKGKKAHLRHFRRYEDTPSGVSPLPIPGSPAIYYNNSTEHDEEGYTSEAEENHQRMVRKRFRKLDQVHARTSFYCDPGHAGKVGIMGWCGSKGAIHDAVTAARAEGYDVTHLYSNVLHPLHPSLGQLLTQMDTVIVPELNHTGQLATYLASQGITTLKVTKTTGYPFTVEELTEVLRAECPKT